MTAYAPLAPTPLAPAAAPSGPAHASQLDVAGALLDLLRGTATEPRPDTQLEALTLAVAADLPVLLWGEPGIGKTAALTRLAEALDLPLTTVIASVHEPSDFSGLPVIGDDPAEQGVPMAPPDWAVRLVRAGRGLLFLDELSTAPPAVQAALLRLVLERRVGSLQLPPGVRIVAAANPRSSAADGWELSPPLANRFVHLQWTHDHEVVVRGLGGTWPRATLPRLDPDRSVGAVDFARRAVCGLLTARPELVHRLPTSETRRGGPWPSPRSWEMTLRLIAFATAAGSSRDVLSLLVRGTVGDGPGLELLASLDRMDLPDPEVLLADPAGAELPERGDLRQAVLDAVVAAVRARPEKSRWDAAWALLVRALETGAPDLVVVPATTLAALRREDWDVPASIERLAGAVSLSRRADHAAVRTGARAEAAAAAAAIAARAARAGAPGTLDRDKLFAARLHAVRARPYLATALFALHAVESRRVPTMAVDRHWRCYVSPAFVDRTPVEELAGVWVHEVSHLLRDHHGRSDRVARRRGLAGPGERLRMNIAADCEINDDAFGDGLTKPEGAVEPRTLGLPAGELMEDYLRQFRLGPRTADLTWLDCGSGANGLDREWDLGPDGAHGLSEQEKDAVRFRVAQGITGRPGTAPKGWRRWAEEAYHPPQPWRDLLGAALRSAASGSGAGEDYTYGRPSRRSAGVPGAVLPSLRRRPPRVCVVIDTSGSVSDAELGSALHEVAAIARAVGGRRELVTVVPCDASARIVHPLCRAEGIPLWGGGGTDLRTGFAKALRAQARPDVIVVLTDGQTPWPDARPPCRTVVGLFPRRDASGSWDEDDPDYVPDSPPAWARVVDIG